MSNPILSDDLKIYLNSLTTDQLNNLTTYQYNANNELGYDITPEQANYFLKLYNDIIEQEEEIDRICDNEIETTKENVNSFREKRKAELAVDKEYYTNMLREFATKKLAGQKSKTFKLPHGNLSFRKQAPIYNYDDAELIKELKEKGNDNIIKTVVSEKIDKTLLKKTGDIVDDDLYINGNKIECVNIVQQEDAFKIS